MNFETLQEENNIKLSQFTESQHKQAGTILDKLHLRC